MLFRPTWHKVAGALQLVFAAMLLVLNYAESEGVGVLPGGHSPLYFLAALLVGFTALWWFGAFDRNA